MVIVWRAKSEPLYVGCSAWVGAYIRIRRDADGYGPLGAAITRVYRLFDPDDASAGEPRGSSKGKKNVCDELHAANNWPRSTAVYG